MCLRPGSSSQSCDPRLEDAQEEFVGVFSHNGKVNGGQEDGSMDDEPDDDGYHVHPQLPTNHLQIFNRDDFAADQAGNTEGRVPVGGQSYYRKCNFFVITDL